MVRVTELWAEHHTAALGIGESSPRLSWRRQDDGAPAEQDAYELEVVCGTGPAAIHRTGRVAGSVSTLVDWPTKPLESRERATVRVRLWTGDESEPGPWSAPLPVETGLLHSEDWTVPFVSPSTAAAAGVRPAYLLRAEFTVPAADTVLRARVYSTAHGVHDVLVNGAPVNDHLLAPGWTSYRHRLRYQTVDVTDMLQPGPNAIGVWLGDGWWRGKLGFNGGLWNNYGDDVSLLLQLEITRTDGSVHEIDLNDAWRWAPSPITGTGLYEGEAHDARLDLNGWAEPGFPATGWRAPTMLPRTLFPTALVAPTGPPVRVTEELAPIAIEHRPGNRIRLDFGQNISGKLRISPTGKTGHAVVLHHAEVLEVDELSIRPLRGAPSVDRYVLAGTGRPETWTPRFTVHGFRYAELENWPGEFDAADVVALVVHSDMVRTGHFDSSDPMLNRLHENVIWSMRDNFVDLPTDCPQRDERLGWTGDIQVFGPTAAFLYQSTGTLLGWLRDVAAEQRERGSVPNFVPWIECGFPADPAAAWGDVAVVLPWVLYSRTGDAKILADQYESMCAWVDQVAELTGGTGLWNAGFQLGDWLDPASPPDRPDESHTDPYLVATAYHAHSARLLARSAGVLGRPDDEAHYLAIAERAVDAFRAEFVTPSGRVVSDTETALSLAIVFDLLETEEQIRNAGSRLVQLVEHGGHTIRTGFVGTPIICDALARVDAFDTAYHLLLQTDFPSWLYPVTMGATTIWERWDSMLPDGSINPGEMTSFNHYSLGAVADYLHRVIGGLAPAAPGYRELEVAPRPGGGLTHARAELLTPFGRASSAWARVGNDFTLDVIVPAGAVARVTMPDGTPPQTVGPGCHRFRAVVRPAEDDPAPPARVNHHNPQEREAVALLD
jgi:alpha-L-rhamnosidase